MKYKSKYEVDIPIMFVVGVIFLIWGFLLLGDAVSIRKNLKNIYDENVDVTKLKEGNYITVDEVKVLGGIIKSSGRYTTWGVELFNLTTNNYYAINFNGNEEQYMSLLIKQGVFGDLNEHSDDNGFITLSDKYDVFNTSFDLKVVKMDGNHQDCLSRAREYLDFDSKEIGIIVEDSDNIDFYDEIALVPVSYDKEREVLVWAFSILFCAALLILASKPWKFVEKIYVPIREFNLIYKEETDESDITLIAELARTLRMDIKYYESDYNAIKKKIRRNIIALALSLIIYLLVKYALRIQYIEFMLPFFVLPIVLSVKLVIGVLKLLLNKDTRFTKSIMSAFGKEPIMSILNDRNEKLLKCDEVIKESLYKNRDEHAIKKEEDKK